MDKMKKLRLENEVLKNMVACIQQEIELFNNFEGENRYKVYETIGAISSISHSFESNLETAVILGHAVDFRKKPKKECPNVPLICQEELGSGAFEKGRGAAD